MPKYFFCIQKIYHKTKKKVGSGFYLPYFVFLLKVTYVLQVCFT